MNTINSAMRNAFLNMKCKNVASPIVTTCLHVLATKSGTKPVGRGWTADLSMRTFKKLQSEGIFA